MKQKYIFLDIDGTLYSTEIRRTPESALIAIKKARQNGHKVFLCTGRTWCECAEYFQYETDGFIFGAGSCIYTDGKFIFDQPIPTLDVMEIIKSADELNLAYLQEGKRHSYCNQSGYEWSLDYFSTDDKTPEEKKQKLDSLSILYDELGYKNEDIYKVFYFSKEMEPLKKHEKQLQEPYRLVVTHADEGVLCGAEVTNKALTKSGGIKQVLEYYGASQEDTIGIGDSMNDIDMIQYCHIGIAMGNALPKAKEIADYVTTDILDDGIYHAFEHCGLI
ncbi:MAG: HAD family hydrolase [Solobacterium sp.]|nr:HAD family hydrolase [Solobacterium sp.]